MLSTSRSALASSQPWVNKNGILFALGFNYNFITALKTSLELSMGNNLVSPSNILVITQWLSLTLPRIELDVSQCVEGSKIIAICPNVLVDQKKVTG